MKMSCGKPKNLWGSASAAQVGPHRRESGK